MSVVVAAAPELTIDGDPQAGYATVTWSLPGAPADTEFQLQEAHAADFAGAGAPIYQGPHHSTVLSGLPDGERFYRVRGRRGGGAWGPWSTARSLVVEHHSLEFASVLFGIGALVFLGTVAFLLSVRRKEYDD